MKLKKKKKKKIFFDFFFFFFFLEKKVQSRPRNFRVGRGTGNTAIFFFGLIGYYILKTSTISVEISNFRKIRNKIDT